MGLLWSFKFVFLDGNFFSVVFFGNGGRVPIFLDDLLRVLLFSFILVALRLDKYRILGEVLEAQRVFVGTGQCVEAQRHVLLVVFLLVLLLALQDDLGSAVLVSVILPLLVVELLRGSLF